MGFKAPHQEGGDEPWETWKQDLRDFCRGDRKEGLVRRLAALARDNNRLKIQVWKSGGTHFHVACPPARESSPVLVAHYDSVAGTPGANDNGASVHHLLSLLRRTKAGEAGFHVIFTDREELSPGQGFRDQGSYHLRTPLWEAGLLEGFFLVFDMTGIGDTPVLGCGTEAGLRSRGLTLSQDMADRWKHNRLRAQRLLGALGGRGIMELPTPFSDDLGLLGQGIPAVQLSLLPWKEASVCRQTGKVHPPSWETMHTSGDEVDTLERESWDLMTRLLDRLVRQPLF